MESTKEKTREDNLTEKKAPVRSSEKIHFIKTFQIILETAAYLYIIFSNHDGVNN